MPRSAYAGLSSLDALQIAFFMGRAQLVASRGRGLAANYRLKSFRSYRKLTAPFRGMGQWGIFRYVQA